MEKICLWASTFYPAQLYVSYSILLFFRKKKKNDVMREGQMSSETYSEAAEGGSNTKSAFFELGEFAQCHV